MFFFKEILENVDHGTIVWLVALCWHNF